MKFFRHASLILFLLVFCATQVSAADFFDDLRRDFTPVQGVVIMPVDGEFLIDVDARQGVVPGDLFAVVRSGERIVHPVSGEVIGTLDDAKAVLRVTRVRTGYSYAVPVGDAETVKRGDTVRRYEHVSALFWDYAGLGEEFFQELRAGLPVFDWQPYAAAQSKRPEGHDAPIKYNAHLAFVARGNQLSVVGPGGQISHSYVLPAAQAAVAPAPVVPATPAVPSVVPAVPSAPQRPGIVAAAPPSRGGIVRQQEDLWEGVWVTAEIDGNPVGLEVADLTGDGRKEVAVLFTDRLEVGWIDGRDYRTLATLDFDGMEKSLTIAAADLNEDGRSELYITAMRNGRLASRTVVLEGSSLRIVESGIPWYLRTVVWPGEGPILLAQRMGNLDNDFDGPLFRVSQSGGKLVEGPALNTPRSLSIFGFVPILGASGKIQFVRLNDADQLQLITGDGKRLWESSQKFGGSEVFFERDDSSPAATLPQKRAVLVPPPLSIGPAGEILVPASEGIRLSVRTRKLGPSRVVAMQLEGSLLREAWHTQPQDGYLVDFRLADVTGDGNLELLQAVNFSRPVLTGTGRAAIIVYELQ